jgi:hypothetical protein
MKGNMIEKNKRCKGGKGGRKRFTAIAVAAMMCCGVLGQNYTNTISVTNSTDAALQKIAYRLQMVETNVDIMRQMMTNATITIAGGVPGTNAVTNASGTFLVTSNVVSMIGVTNPVGVPFLAVSNVASGTTVGVTNSSATILLITISTNGIGSGVATPMFVVGSSTNAVTNASGTTLAMTSALLDKTVSTNSGTAPTNNIFVAYYISTNLPTALASGSAASPWMDQYRRQVIAGYSQSLNSLATTEQSPAVFQVFPAQPWANFVMTGSITNTNSTAVDVSLYYHHTWQLVLTNVAPASSMSGAFTIQTSLDNTNFVNVQTNYFDITNATISLGYTFDRKTFYNMISLQTTNVSGYGVIQFHGN